jgi:serine/threonine-protein kinase RsbW
MNNTMTKLLDLRLDCNPQNIREVRRQVRELADKLNYPSSDRFHLELAVDEACVNAIEHGSSSSCSMIFELEFYKNEHNLIILVKDFGGKHFNPNYFERICKQKTWRKGGKGIHIIKELMDEVMYILNQGRSTTLCMVKRLPPPAEEK